MNIVNVLLRTQFPEVAIQPLESKPFYTDGVIFHDVSRFPLGQAESGTRNMRTLPSFHHSPYPPFALTCFSHSPIFTLIPCIYTYISVTMHHFFSASHSIMIYFNIYIHVYFIYCRVCTYKGLTYNEMQSMKMKISHVYIQIFTQLLNCKIKK